MSDSEGDVQIFEIVSAELGSAEDLITVEQNNVQNVNAKKSCAKTGLSRKRKRCPDNWERKLKQRER